MSVLPKFLEYTAGSEHNPGNPFGRTVLVIESTGDARLVLTVRGGARRGWSGKIDLATLRSAWKALLRGGFPTVPQHRVPAGATMRVLTAEGSFGMQGAMVEWHAAHDLQGYREAFPILDSIVCQLSQDTIKAARNTLPPVVSDIIADP